jgi:hypothetical protein
MASAPRLWLMILIFLCMFAAGFGPSDYVIPVYGDYYIVRLGGNVFSLGRELPPVEVGDKTQRFEIVYDGIYRYGQSDGIIYGSTIQNSFFVFNPPQPIRIYLDREKWLDALGELGVHELALIAPRPPEDEGEIIQPAFWWWCIGIILFPSAVIVLITLALRKLKRKQGVHPINDH